MPLTEGDIIKQLNELISFLESVHSLADSHLGSFFLENAWNKHVPIIIQSELNNLGSIKNFIELYPKIIKNNCPNEFAEAHPNLIKFLTTVTSISVTREEQYTKSLRDLENLFSTKNCRRSNDIKKEGFMSPKKFHEVKITSRAAAFVSQVTQSSHIVDVGGGKGYLSCILALCYSFKVLGLDSSEVTTCGALKISGKMAKLWNGEICGHFKDTQLEKNTKEDREEFVHKHYKQIITFVNPDTNVENLLRESFNEEITGITLTGLHTCGNLASTCLQMFLSCRKIKGLINVGCCYNHISEEFICDSFEQDGKNEKHYGFPMSTFLRRKNYGLGRNARMLAAHSLDRINSSSEFEAGVISFHDISLKHTLKLFSSAARAVLETVKLDSLIGQGKVGRLARKCNSFHEYMFTAVKKLGISTQLTANDLDKLYERYIDKKPLLTAFYLLRISLAPIVESIILLDRILYLIENGINNAYLVPLFNLEISPRGFGIIAWKDFDKG